MSADRRAIVFTDDNHLTASFSRTLAPILGERIAAAMRLAESQTETADMCRNIKTLANFEPPATDDEIRASALQFVRKLSGTARPSRANQAAFDRAVEVVTAAAERLIRSLETNAPPRDREEERLKAQERSRKRFG